MSKRAYGSQDKLARRHHILDAARRLFHQGGGELPSVARIAEAAGLAKGTIYLYFETREAIYADLLLQGWADVLRGVEQVFGTDAEPAAKVTAFVSSYTAYLDGHPELLRLDALGPAIIERNLAPATFAAFKQSLNGHLATGGWAIERGLGLPPDRGLQLLMRSHALTRGMWLSFGEDAGKHFSPDKPHADFRSELAEALAEYWRGALADAAG